MHWVTRLKCWLGFHWWLTWDDQPCEEYHPMRVVTPRLICGWCKKVWP